MLPWRRICTALSERCPFVQSHPLQTSRSRRRCVSPRKWTSLVLVARLRRLRWKAVGCQEERVVPIPFSVGSNGVVTGRFFLLTMVQLKSWLSAVWWAREISTLVVLSRMVFLPGRHKMSDNPAVATSAHVISPSALWCLSLLWCCLAPVILTPGFLRCVAQNPRIQVTLN